MEDRQKEFQALQGSVTAVQIRLDEANEKLARSERDQAAALRRIQQLEDTLAETRDALRAKELELEAARRELVPLQTSLAQAEVDLHQARNDLAANNHELEFIMSRMGFLSEKVSGSSTLRAQPRGERFSPAMPTSPQAAPSFGMAYAPSRSVAPLASTTVPLSSGPAQAPGVFSMTGINLEQLALVDFPGDLAISIPELLCACLDPNWREAFIAGQKPEAFRLIPKEAPVAAGGHFYEVIEEFMDWLLSDAASSQGVAEWNEQELWKAMHDMLLEHRLNAFVAQGQFNETNFLSRRLRSFCQRLGQLRQQTTGFRFWADVFPPELVDVPRAVFPMGDRRLVVTGSIHGIRRHAQWGLELVDYKVLPTAAEGNHLLPLALNALILGALRPNTGFGLGLEIFSPEISAIAVPHAEVNALLRERVVPVFYELVNRPLPADLKNLNLNFILQPSGPAALR
ncbi:MAG: hypothetical protein HC904_04480 [Blastochloris sp.]|nr:hypothetical protein [Blastochloris sp.]